MQANDSTVQQGTQEWFEQRKLRITGSRIGAILGLSPWQTRADVLRAMVREHHGAPSEFAGNPATDHGRANEQRAQLAFMRETGLNVEKCGFFPYGDRMGASPDGLTSDGGVLEVKVPFGLRNNPKAEFKPLAEQPHYAVQVQMEMLAAEPEHAYFAQYVAPKGDPFSADYVPEQISIERVQKDEGWIDRVLPDISAFYDLLLSELDNPEHLEPLRVSIDTEEVAAKLAELDMLRKRQKDDEASEKAILADLVKMADGKNALLCGRKLTKTKDGESVAYAKALAALLPDADLKPWTSPKKGSWRLT
jgi:putative phage-type endonuclease